MAPKPYVQPIVDSTSVFKPDIFKGKVLFCTGGGSGICKGMTEAIVRLFVCAGRLRSLGRGKKLTALGLV